MNAASGATWLSVMMSRMMMKQEKNKSLTNLALRERDRNDE